MRGKKKALPAGTGTAPDETTPTASTTSNDNPQDGENQATQGKNPPKTRGYVGMLYEDSAPSDWQERLNDLHIPAIVSPWHDRDVNPDGTPKKKHRHVMIIFDGPRALKQAQEVLTSIGCIGYCQPVQSITGQARYMCHLDNPEKAQYDPADVLQLSGADYEELCQKTVDRMKAIADMCDFVDANCIYSFAELVRYARANEQTWFRHLASDCTIFMREYIKSNYWEDQGGYNHETSGND